MAKYGSSDVAAVLVDGVNLVSTSRSINHKKGAVTEEVTVLGDSWRHHADTGLREMAFSYEGFYDDDALDAHVVSTNGTAPVILLIADGNSDPAGGVGKYCTGFAGPVQAAYDRVVELGALHKAVISFEGSGEVEDGVLLHSLSAETADDDTEGEYHDGGAASALGATGYLQVTAITLDTATNLVVKLRHSVDAIAWADLGTFTAVTAIGAERIEIAAGASTPRRYLASSWTWTGGAGAGSTATFAVACHRIGAAQ